MEPQPRCPAALMLSPFTGASVESETISSAKSPTPVIMQLVLKKRSFELLTLVPVMDFAEVTVEEGTTGVELGGVVLGGIVADLPEIA